MVSTFTVNGCTRRKTFEEKNTIDTGKGYLEHYLTLNLPTGMKNKKRAFFIVYLNGQTIFRLQHHTKVLL